MTPEQLKNSILQYAIQGKLVEQRKEEGTAEELYQKIQEEKQKLIKEGKIKKQKELPEITESEIPFDVPKTWKWVRLGDIVKLITDGTHKTPNYVNEGVPFLSVQNISSGKFTFDKIKYISKEEHEILSKRVKPQKHDILFCRIGTLGKAIKIDFDMEFSIFVSLGLIRLIDININEYILNYLKSPIISKWIDAIKVGGGTHTFKINLRDIPNMLVPLPPLEEQKRIVAKIEELLPFVDDYAKSYEELEKLNAKFPENIKKSILQYAIQGKLVEQRKEEGTAEELYQKIQEEKQKLLKEGKLKKQKELPEITESEIPFDIPESWKWTRFGECCEIYTGNSISESIKKTKYLGLKRGLDYIATKDVNFDTTINYDNGIRIPIGDKFKIAKSQSILMCIEGGSAGRKIGILDRDVCFGNKLCMFNSKLVFNRFIFYYLQSDGFKNNFSQNISGIIGGVSINRIKSLFIPLPPLEEQKRIVDKIDELLPLCENLNIK